MSTTAPRVAVVCGSANDLPIMEATVEELARFGVACERYVTSAHRSPERTRAWAGGLAGRGVQVVVAGAGMAAHLAGVLAAELTMPVIAVPLPSSTLGGLDALLSSVQMPAGVPVATMAIGEAGARNAGVFAVQILAVGDAELRERLQEHKRGLAHGVARRAAEAGL